MPQRGNGRREREETSEGGGPDPDRTEAALAAMMDLIKQDLARLNIHHQVFFSERTLHGPGGEDGAHRLCVGAGGEENKGNGTSDGVRAELQGSPDALTAAGGVDPGDATQLRLATPNLQPGTYEARVVWFSTDGHGPDR